jgi:RNA polymerase sigma-70 factor (ECF subfamily)
VIAEPLSDAALIALILSGDPDGSTMLVNRYTPSLRRLLLHAGARNEEVDDLLQETWIRAIRSAHRYDPEQPFARWLFTIAMNRLRTAAGRRRQSDATTEALADDSDAVPSSRAAADETIDAAQRGATLRQHIAALPPHLADAILLRYFEELSEKQMASALGIPVGTVKSRLHTAVKRLRLDLERIFHV